MQANRDLGAAACPQRTPQFPVPFTPWRVPALDIHTARCRTARPYSPRAVPTNTHIFRAGVHQARPGSVHPAGPPVPSGDERVAEAVRQGAVVRQRDRHGCHRGRARSAVAGVLL